MGRRGIEMITETALTSTLSIQRFVFFSFASALLALFKAFFKDIVGWFYCILFWSLFIFRTTFI